MTTTQSSNLNEDLYELCKRNEEDLTKIQELIKNGANVNELLKNGDTCLCIACNKGFEKIVKILIENKADVNLCRSPTSIMSTNMTSGIISARRQSRLSYATSHQNQQQIKGDSPLIICIKYGYENISEYLIDNGADVTGIKTNDKAIVVDFERSPLHEAIRLNRYKIIDKILKSVYEKPDVETIEWIISKRYDLLRNIFITENIEAIRIVLPYILDKQNIEGELLAHILNYMLMKSKIHEKKDKAYEILQTVMEICACDDENLQNSDGFQIRDIEFLVKGFLATIRAQFNTLGSDDNRTDLLHFRASLFFFIIKYNNSIKNFSNFYSDIDYTFNFFYTKMRDTGENILKLIEFFITFYDILITMNHLKLNLKNIKDLLSLQHVKQIDILGDFLIQRTLTPLDLKELCRIHIKQSFKTYNLYSINKLPLIDDELKAYLFYN